MSFSLSACLPRCLFSCLHLVVSISCLPVCDLPTFLPSSIVYRSDPPSSLSLSLSLSCPAAYSERTNDQSTLVAQVQAQAPRYLAHTPTHTHEIQYRFPIYLQACRLPTRVPVLGAPRPVETSPVVIPHPCLGVRALGRDHSSRFWTLPFRWLVRPCRPRLLSLVAGMNATVPRSVFSLAL